MSLFKNSDVENYVKRFPDCSFTKYALQSKSSVITKNLQILSEWFEKMPDGKKDELRREIFKSDNPWPAIFEIGLYQLFHSQGCNVLIHPLQGLMKNHKKKSPDFLVTTADNTKFYIEIFNISESQKNIESLMLTEDLNSKLADFASDKFRIHGEVIVACGKLDVKTVESFLSIILQNETDDRILMSQFNQDGWLIDFYFHPLKDYSQQPVPIVKLDYYPRPDYEHINRKILYKAAKYNALDYPFVLAVNLDSLVELPRNITDICLGKVNWVYKGDTRTWTGHTESVLEPKGLWEFYEGSRNVSVSAIILTRFNFPFPCYKDDLWIAFKNDGNLDTEFYHKISGLLKTEEISGKANATPLIEDGMLKILHTDLCRLLGLKSCNNIEEYWASFDP